MKFRLYDKIENNLDKTIIIVPFWDTSLNFSNFDVVLSFISSPYHLLEVDARKSTFLIR